VLRAVLYACVGAAVITGGARADRVVEVPGPAPPIEARAADVTAELATATELAPPLEHRDSVSCGCANRGALAGGIELAVQGFAHVIPEPWAARGHRFATAELVGALERASAAVSIAHPGAVLGVADPSAEHGGALPGHRSHQSGRDADLLFYALDPDGNPMPPDGYMPVYTRTGRASYARAPQWTRNIPERYFDLARNWALVRALLTDPEVEVDRIFVSHRIRRWLLDYAEERGEPEELRQRAALALRRPSKAASHDDHLHLRIKCSADDITAGRCNDDPAPRKKRKYHTRIRCPR
jgi:penicillin-insensitive murein DD-endopeptidase